MRLLLLMMVVLGAWSCGGQAAGDVGAAPLVPRSSSAFLNYLGGQVFIQMTEQDPKAVTYSHRPRSVHLIVPLPDATRSPATPYRLIRAAEDAHLPADAATLRVLEYGVLPRAYQVKAGTLTMVLVQDGGGNGLGTVTLHLDALVEDPVDGVPDLHLEGDFQVAIGGIS